MGITIYRNNQIGNVPQTPIELVDDEVTTPESRRTLLEFGAILGTPVGYMQEQNGRLIQNLYPVKKTETDQISTSSKVILEMHTETAFHPYRPSFVLLLCLRGDESAATTYADSYEIVSQLSEEAVETLQQNWFTTRIDQSFRTHGEEDMEMVVPVLERTTGSSVDEFKLTYDSYFMQPKGVDDESHSMAIRALSEFRDAVENCTKEVVLKTGDLLVINNKYTIHGRKPFMPRYDGADRWLQRLLVIDKTPPSHQMNGNIITTRFDLRSTTRTSRG